MEAKVDPRTGGIVFEDKDHEHEEVQKITEYIHSISPLATYGIKGGNSDINCAYDPIQSRLSFEERYALVRSVGEECIEEEELKKLLKNKVHPICYDGFEPSGRMHIAQGVLKMINVNKLVDSGCIFIFWVADWFAFMNNKMGGDLEKIKDVGRYFIEIWRGIGMKMSNVKFLWASEEIAKHWSEYWVRVMDIAKRNSLRRLRRCCTIMGREDMDKEKEEEEEIEGKVTFPTANVLYPCMQCSDIFFLKADICQLGMDQKKVNMLAREYCTSIGKKDKPVILSHHMLMGLKEGHEKMSKSDPDSAIFMEDDEKTVKDKIKKAFCPPQVIAKNPILDYTKHILFPYFNEVQIKRKPENGGDKTYKTYEELEKDFASEALHPGDLKPAVSDAINRILQPVRDHFARDPEAKAILERVRSYRVTK